MRSKKIYSSNIIGWIVLIAAIALIYFSYFFIYIPHQEELVKQRSFRILKEYAGNMSEKYHYYKKHLDNYNEFYNLLYLKNNSTESLKKELNNAIERDSTLEDLLISLEPSINTSTENKLNKRFGIYSLGSRKSLIMEYSRESEEDLIKLLNSVLPPNKRNLNTRQNLEKEVKKAYVHRVPFSTLMQGLKFDNLLNNITLFTDSAVVYNSNLEVVNAITNPTALADSIKRQQGGIVEIISVGGEPNHVMILPFYFEGIKFYLAGFITENRYNSKTRSISGQLLIIITGVLLLVLIGMPVLKIIFLGRNERLHTYDANAAIISFILGVSILVLISTSILKHNVHDRILLSERLERISLKLYTNISDQIDEITSIYYEIVKESNADSELPSFVREFFQDSLAEKKYVKISPDLQNKTFPVNEIFLMNDSGKIDKAVTRTAFYGPLTIDVSERLYFKNIKDPDKSWYLPKPTDRQHKTPYYMQSIKSYNTGYAEAAISFQLNEKERKLFGAPFLAITSHIPALFDQVLPADVEFLIINQKGDVMFHSIQRKNLHENFLAESNYNLLLQDAIEHRTSKITRINYNEKPWLANIRPIKDMPLYHITLIDIQQTQSKNARILIFSSYFLIASFICILAGFFILNFIRSGNNLDKQHQWSLNWLLFSPDKRNNYLSLLIFQIFILLFQISGLFIPEKPFTMFVYQIIYIVFGAYVIFILLNTEKDHFQGFLSNPKAIPVIILIITFILMLVFLITGGLWVLLPAAVIFSTFIWISQITGNAREKHISLPGYIGVVADKVFTSDESSRAKEEEKNDAVITKKIFHLFLFLWLAGISAVPVLQYYDSVKRQEEILWRKMQTEHLAAKNLALKQNYQIKEKPDWYDQISGEEIENIKIDPEINLTDRNKEELFFPDKIYTWLPVPIGNELYMNGLLYDKNPTSEWFYEKKDRESLYLSYSGAGSRDKVIIKGPQIDRLNIFTWLFYFSIPLILVTLLIYLLQRYLSGNILNTDYIDWEMPEQPSWDNILKKKEINRILLISFTPDSYLDQTENYYIQKEQEKDIEVIHVSDLQRAALNKSRLERLPVVWIKGLAEYLKDEKRFCRIAPKFRELLSNISGKLIIELPFDIDFIEEKIEEKFEAMKKGEKDQRFIHNIQNELPTLLKDFYRYAGMRYLPEEKESSEPNEYMTTSNITFDSNQREEEQLISLKYALKFRYYFIWNQLTRIEKLILYDLADDGLLNLKNRPLLNRLMLKGLIVFDPYPKLFAKSFQYFILHAIDPSETKIIEKELGKEGNWRNTKYILWILLIPLIGFVFIAQGTSIEKVIGILSGGIAVIAGLLRVFNSGGIKQSG